MMQSVELFSGCGGLALGIARAGFEHVRLVEWDEAACATLAHNQRRGVMYARDWPFSQGDVRLVDWMAIPGDDLDLVTGGPPCQPFSIGGKHAGKSDARDMWPEAVRAVREVQPKAFIFENVRGLARPAFAEYLTWITTNLSVPSSARYDDETHAHHLGRMMRQGIAARKYDVLVLKVNAADYGAAQKRHRVIVAGLRRDLGGKIAPPIPTHSRERLLWDQWISGDYWTRHGIHAPSGPKTADRRMVNTLSTRLNAPPEAPWRTVRDALVGLGEPNGDNDHGHPDGARVYPGHTGSPLDEPAKALKAGDHGVPGGENMMVRHDGSVRYFTVREAARLQGFPDEWGFVGSWSGNMRQLGNAVPTELANALGRWISDIIGAASLAWGKGARGPSRHLHVVGLGRAHNARDERRQQSGPKPARRMTCTRPPPRWRYRVSAVPSPSRAR